MTKNQELGEELIFILFQMLLIWIFQLQQICMFIELEGKFNNQKDYYFLKLEQLEDLTKVRQFHLLLKTNEKFLNKFKKILMNKVTIFIIL